MIDVKDIVDEVNIAELLSDELLKEVGDHVVRLYNEDEQSRQGWLNNYVTSLSLAMQVKENKTWPWPNAANVKFPMMTLAAITFHSRAYPSLIPSRELVHAKTIGNDFLGFKRRRADRIQKHLNYQFLDQIEEWEEEMDRLLLILPITGTEFKKLYYNPDLERIVIKHVFAKDLVIDYYSKEMKGSRKTEIMSMTTNEIKEMVAFGLFLNHDFSPGQPREDKTTQVSDKIQGLKAPSNSKYAPRVILEQHGYYDLDQDGYEEPYIFTVDKDTKKVLRIVARFKKKNIIYRNKEIAKITPDEYYIKYSFIPSVDGGFYDIGFGHLVGPLNEATNTILNQLIDAGTLSNLQSGFISKSFRMKTGSATFEPGEWKVVNASMQDIKHGVYPLPVREPSTVLFQLLGLLIDVVQRISSTTDIMVGENPGQNQKATTTMQVVENGMRVFTAIYKRLRRSLTSEIKHVYLLNKDTLDPKEYFNIIDPDTQDMKELSVLSKDYEDESIDIIPTADPNAVSQLQKIARAEFLLKMVQLGAPLRQVLKRVYEAYEIENPEEVLPPDPATVPPPPEVMQKERELALEEAELNINAQLDTREQDRKELETLHKIRQADEKLDVDAADKQSKVMIGAMDIASRQISDRRKIDADKAKSRGDK